MDDSDANWVLLHKYDKGLPREFLEVRWFGESVFTATGQVETWGAEELHTLPSRQQAFSDYERYYRAALGAGFELTRSLRYDPASFDAALLTAEVSAAAREAVSHVRRAYRALNAFALLTDSSAMTLGLVAGIVDPSVSPLEADSVWNGEEWSVFEGGAYFDVAYRIILAQHRGLESQVEFAVFRGQMFEACVRSLEGLIHEGLFGDSLDRQNVVIRFQVSDDDEFEGAMERLNTPRVMERYRTWLAQYAW